MTTKNAHLIYRYIDQKDEGT